MKFGFLAFKLLFMYFVLAIRLAYLIKFIVFLIAVVLVILVPTMEYYLSDIVGIIRILEPLLWPLVATALSWRDTKLHVRNLYFVFIAIGVVIATFDYEGGIVASMILSFAILANSLSLVE